MVDLNQLLADPQGYEVIWDYCLENNIPAPSLGPPPSSPVLTVCMSPLGCSGAKANMDIKHSFSGNSSLYLANGHKVSSSGRFRASSYSVTRGINRASSGGSNPDISGHVFSWKLHEIC